MSANRRTTCEELIIWLRENLGRAPLAALTGTDGRALSAAVHILSLYAHGPNVGDRTDAGILSAFRCVVMCMQPQTREFAYHAIAFILDWDDRARLWSAAGLPRISPMQFWLVHDPTVRKAV